MNDHYLPVVYFAFLIAVTAAAAVAGIRKGRNGLVGFFAVVWVLLVLWSLASTAGITFGKVIAVVVIFTIALALVYIPMARVIQSKSFVTLFAWGQVGAAISSVISFLLIIIIPCSFLGDCL